ncbi:hypothetical protein F5Y04DRAFT_252688 [Hypomontagnella monticulosa]|nr:hypothetical protein F5Y04DRAFT_252688 [Hypomontagnella monticulosa]
MSLKLDPCDTALIDMSTSSSTVAGDLTPSHSTTDDLSNDVYSQPRIHRTDVVPWPGHAFINRDPVSGRQIAKVGHHAGDRGVTIGSVYYWICVNKNGWLGFCYPVHNLYMGYNTKGNHSTRGDYVAEVKHHRQCEIFVSEGTQMVGIFSYPTIRKSYGKLSGKTDTN